MADSKGSYHDTTPLDPPLESPMTMTTVQARGLLNDEFHGHSGQLCPNCSYGLLRVQVLPLRKQPREGQIVEAYCHGCGSAGQKLVGYSTSATSSAK
jgi:hypothetical protein